uniref:Aspartyl/glutamyl-tRNA(Asn/Gln) amidotransferase subunit C n=1 Tax=Talaromyces marneffei PM1 TaxID=1077442 RepID=A0A093VMZ9_TALMA
MPFANGLSSKPAYKFGVEIEMFIIFKAEPEDIRLEDTMASQLEKVADNIAELYNSTISELPPGEPEVKYPSMTRQDWKSDIVETHPTRWEINNFWEIHDDPSLYMFGIEQCDGWPLEFASPIFDYSIMMSHDHVVRGRYVYPWMSSIKKLFTFLQDKTIVLVDNECALQVSVSANDHYGWDSLEQVKSLSKSILYFEHAIRSVLPQDRHDNDYAKWNGSPTQTTSTITRMNPQFEGTSGVELRIALVDACATVAELIELMNNDQKRWSWNFTNLEADANSNLIHGRVEFRSPPAVDNWRECAAWIHFTMEFVHAAISTRATMHRLGAFESDWEGLMKFLDSVPPLMSNDSKVTYRRELGLSDN